MRMSERTCLNCQTDISHKKKTAFYCTEDCYRIKNKDYYKNYWKRRYRLKKEKDVSCN